MPGGSGRVVDDLLVGFALGNGGRQGCGLAPSQEYKPKGLECNPKDVITYMLTDEEGGVICGKFLYVTKVSGNVLTGLDLNRCPADTYRKEVSITLGDHCCVSEVHKSGVESGHMDRILDLEKVSAGRLMEFVSSVERTDKLTISYEKPEPEEQPSLGRRLLGKLRRT